MSSESVDAYWSISLMPAKSVNCFNRLGFLKADDFSILSLKCTPCFFKSRNRANFFVGPGGGDLGGDGGISKLGTGGSVRFRITSRVEEYGDWGIDAELFGDNPCGGVTEGPRDGPIAGPSVLGCASAGPGGNDGPMGGLVSFGALLYCF